MELHFLDSATSRALLIVLLFVALAVSLVLSGKASAPETPDVTLLRRGQAVWRSHNCVACHTVYGLGGYLGPDLTNVISRRGPGYVTAVLRSGLPGMPKFKIEAKDTEALEAYLNWIDRTGVFPSRGYPPPPFGAIAQPGEAAGGR